MNFWHLNLLDFSANKQSRNAKQLKILPNNLFILQNLINKPNSHKQSFGNHSEFKMDFNEPIDEDRPHLLREVGLAHWERGRVGEQQRGEDAGMVDCSLLGVGERDTQIMGAWAGFNGYVAIRLRILRIQVLDFLLICKLMGDLLSEFSKLLFLNMFIKIFGLRLNI